MLSPHGATAEQLQSHQHQQHLLLPGPQPAGCWKSTPGAGSPNCHQPPRLSLSAILPLSAAGSYQNHHEQQQQQQQLSKKKQKQQKCDSNSDSDRTMLPGAAANAAAAAAAAGDESSSLARRFFSNPRVRRSLAIDAACLLIFVPLAVGTSLALMRLFVRRVGEDQLEWHHYMLVAALGSLALVPVFRLAYSGHRYRKRILRMRSASCDPQQQRPRRSAERLSDYTTKSRRIEAAAAARAQEYRQFATLVARQQNIDLSRRGDLSVVNNGGGAGDRSVANVSGISCHRPDISMAAYNC